MSATNDFVAAYTDVYFKRTRRIVERFGDRSVTYAVKKKYKKKKK